VLTASDDADGEASLDALADLLAQDLDAVPN
jgi:phosphocarrier protein